MYGFGFFVISFLIIMSLYISNVSAPSQDLTTIYYGEKMDMTHGSVRVNISLGKDIASYINILNITTPNNIINPTISEIKYESVPVNDYGILPISCSNNWFNLTQSIANPNGTSQSDVGLWYCDNPSMNKTCVDVKNKKCDSPNEIIGTHNEIRENKYPFAYNLVIEQVDSSNKKYNIKTQPPKDLKKGDVITLEFSWKNDIKKMSNGWGSSGKWETLGLDPWWNTSYNRYNISITPPTNWNIPANFTLNITINSTEKSCKTPDGQRIVYHSALGAITDVATELDVVNITGIGGGDNVTLKWKVKENIKVGEINNTAYFLYCNTSNIGTSLAIRNEQNVYAFYDNFSYPNADTMNNTGSWNLTYGIATNINVTGERMIMCANGGPDMHKISSSLSNYTNYTLTYNLRYISGMVDSIQTVFKSFTTGQYPDRTYGQISQNGIYLENKTYFFNISLNLPEKFSANSNKNITLTVNGSFITFGTNNTFSLTATIDRDLGVNKSSMVVFENFGSLISCVDIDNIKQELYIDGQPTISVSNTIEGGNSPPYLINITTFPSNQTSIGKGLSINATLTLNDTEGDLLNVSFTWFEQQGANWIVNISNTTGKHSMPNATNVLATGNGLVLQVPYNLTSYRLGYNYSLGVYYCDGNLCNQTNSSFVFINNTAPYFFNITLWDNINYWNETILTKQFNGSFAVGDVDNDYLNVSTFWYQNDVIIISNNTAGSNMSNYTNVLINGSMRYISQNLTNPTFAVYKLGVYACDSWSCNQSNSSSLYIFQNTTSDFIVSILSNRSDNLIGFGTNISVNAFINNGSNDEIYDVNMSIILPSGGRLFANNNSLNYNQYYWNSTFSTYLNQTGTWIAQVCYKNIWGIYECLNNSIDVNDNVTYLPIEWTFTPDTGEIQTYLNITNIRHSSPESFNFTFNWTDDIILDNNYFNSTIIFNSFILGNNEVGSNYIILNISSSIPALSNFTDNITIARVSAIPGINKTWLIPVFVGVDPPVGIPETHVFTPSAPVCVPPICDISETMTVSNLGIGTRKLLVKNIGGSLLSDCSARIVWGNGSNIFNPSINCIISPTDYSSDIVGSPASSANLGNCYPLGRFDIPVGKWMGLTINYNSAIPQGNYTGNVEVECVASSHEIYNRTLRSAPIDNHPKILINVNALTGGGSSGSSGPTTPVQPSLISNGGSCTNSSKCISQICDLAIDNSTVPERKSIYFQKCITSDMRCGNNVCEKNLQIPEDINNCKQDCAPASAIYLPRWYWFAGLVLAIIIILLVTRSETNKKKRKEKKIENK